MAKPTPNPEPTHNRADRYLAPRSNPPNGREAEEAAPAEARRGAWREPPVATEIEHEPQEETVLEPAEIARMRAENEDLKSEVAELRQLLDETASQEISAFADREKEYESLLEEKTELIRNLHLKIQELDKQPARPVQNEQELLAMSDELERERCQLDQERRQLEEERRQLKEDEHTMMSQMREMEVQMARERAEMARQRNELQRLHSEIRHEIDVAQRDGLLNERLKTLQRKHQEVSNRKGGAPDTMTHGIPPVAPPPPPQPPAAKKDSGLLRRFFGPK